MAGLGSTAYMASKRSSNRRVMKPDPAPSPRPPPVGGNWPAIARAKRRLSVAGWSSDAGSGSRPRTARCRTRRSESLSRWYPIAVRLAGELALSKWPFSAPEPSSDRGGRRRCVRRFKGDGNRAMPRRFLPRCLQDAFGTGRVLPIQICGAAPRTAGVAKSCRTGVQHACLHLSFLRPPHVLAR